MPSRPRSAQRKLEKGDSSWQPSAHGYRGTLRTLTLNTKLAIVEVEKQGDEPDCRVFAGQAEVGAGWRRTSRAVRDYVSLRLDDPTLAEPINATLPYRLICSR